MENKRTAIETHNKSSRNLIMICFVMLAICSITSLFKSTRPTHDLIAVGCFLLTIFACYSKAPNILLKYIHFVVMSSWAIFAVYFLENGNVTLRGAHSLHYGSLPVYSLSWIVFFTVLIVLESKRNKNYIRNSLATRSNYHEVTASRQVLIVAYLALGVLLFSFLSILNKPYFLLGVDRFAYRQTYMNRILLNVSPWFYCFIPVILMTWNNKKYISIIYIVVLSLFCIWQGEKFSGLLRVIFFTMISISPEYAGQVIKRNLKRIVRIAGLFVVALLVVVIIQQVLLYNSTQETILDYFEDRLAAQGELWWLTYGGEQGHGMHLNELTDEINVWIHQPTGTMSDYNFGIYKLMKKFMNSNWVVYTLALGIRATEATRASLYYYGKIPGLIIGQMLCGLLVYFAINNCSNNCKRKNWILSILHMYVLQSVISAVYMMDVQLLTTRRMIVIYLIIVAFTFFKFKIGSKMIIDQTRK